LLSFQAYEDLEFQHMEEVAHREAEKEELLQEIRSDLVPFKYFLKLIVL